MQHGLVDLAVFDQLSELTRFIPSDLGAVKGNGSMLVASS